MPIHNKLARMPIVKDIQAGVFKLEAANKVSPNGDYYAAYITSQPLPGKALDWYNYPLTGKAPY